jgi:hypothetical protein
MPDITFVKFNKNQHYGRHVLLVASQIFLGSLLLVNHLVYTNKHYDYKAKEKFVLLLSFLNYLEAFLDVVSVIITSPHIYYKRDIHFAIHFDL